jgi:hypothetical protein
VCTFINESHSSIEQHSPQECVMCGSIGTEECNPTKGNETSNSSSRGNPPPKKRKADITSFFKPKKWLLSSGGVMCSVYDTQWQSSVKKATCHLKLLLYCKK